MSTETPTPIVASDPEVAKRRFELVTDYTLAGDQPRAVAEMTEALERGDKYQVLLGATGTGKSLGYDDPVFVQEELLGRRTTRVSPIGEVVDEVFERYPSLIARKGDTEVIDLGGELARYYTQSIDPKTGQVGLYPIRSFIRHDTPDEMYHLRLSCGREATLTGNHNLWVLRKGELTLIETADAREDDYVPLPRKLASGRGIEKVDLLELLSETGLKVHASENVAGFATTSARRHALADVFECSGVGGYNKVHRVVGGSSVDVDVMNRILGETRDFEGTWRQDRARIGSQSTTYTLPLDLELTDELLYLIGVNIAEGNTQDNYTMISNHDPKVRAKVWRGLESVGALANVRPSSDIVVGGRVFAELFRTCGGSRSGEKHLPEFWPDLSDRHLATLLRGYYDGDGSVEKTAVVAVTASKRLASDLCYALMRFGIWARLGQTFKRATNSDHEGAWYHQVTVSGQEDLERFSEHIGFNVEHRAARLEGALHGRSNTNVDLIPIDGSKLRALRRGLDLTCEEVGRLSGVTRSAVQSHETETRRPSHTSLMAVLETLRKIANHSDVDGMWWATWESLRGLCDARWSRVDTLDPIEDYAHPHVYDLCVPGPETFLGGVGGMFVHNTFAVSKVIENTQRPTLVMAPNKTLAAQLYSEFKGFFPHNAVEYFVSYYDYYQPEAYIPSTNTFIEKDSAINDAIDRMRHAATRSLFERRDVIIVASVSCIYGLGSSEAYLDMMLFLEEGGQMNREAMLKKLVEIQYDRNDHDFHRGTFRVRGDTIEIFPAHEEDRAIRVEMFGDDIESIYEIDPLRGRRVRQIERIAIYPNSHHVIPAERKKSAIESIQAELRERLEWYVANDRLVEAQRLEQRTQFDVEMMLTMGYCKGVENYSRHLSGRDPGMAPPCLLDYFPKDWLLVIDESHVTVPQVGGMYRGDQARKSSLIDHGFRLPSALDNRPLKFDEFEDTMNQVIFVSATPGNFEVEKTDGVVVEQIIRPTGLIDPIIEIRPATDQVDDVYGEVLIRVERGERVLITTLTKKMSEDLTEYLTELGVKVRYLHSDIDTLERMNLIRDLRKGVFDVLIGINLLREGLDIPEVSLVAILDADKEGFLRSTRSLIQTIGRAARNSNGRVILYADKTTKSMREAIDETDRRRAIQEAYNVEHGITPRTIIKRIHDLEDHIPEEEGAEPRVKESPGIDLSDIDPQIIRDRVADLDTMMRAAAGKLEFEKAASYRDEMRRLEVLLLGLGA